MTQPQTTLEKMAAVTDWLTKQQAAAILGVSVRTVETLAGDGKIQSGKRPQPGSRDATVYNPADVERIRADRQPGSFVVPRVPEASRSLAETSRTHPADTLLAFLADHFANFAKPAENPVETRLFLSVKEASRLTGLTQGYIKELLDSGKLTAVKDGRRLRIRRRDLESL